MSYRGFTWNLTYPEARVLKELLERYVMDYEQPKFHYKIDRHMAGVLLDTIDMFMEVSPDGATFTSGPADA